MTAKVIERVMRKVTDLSHFNISYLTGSSSSFPPKAQTEILESFHIGKVGIFIVPLRKRITFSLPVYLIDE